MSSKEEIKTPIQELIDWYEMNCSEVDFDNPRILHKMQDMLEKERQQLCDFWIEGNKQGWEQQTDWPQDAEEFYNQTFKK